VAPSNFEFAGIRETLDARRTDQTRQCAGRVCPTRKSKNIYLIVRFIVSNHKPVGILDDFFEPETNSSTEQPRDKIAVSPHSVMIVDILHRAVRRPRLYEGLGDNFLSAVQFGYIGIEAGALFTPGPVNQNHDPFHADLA